MPDRAERFLAVRDDEVMEEMDRPDCDPAALATTYAQFPLINAVVSRWHGLYRQRIRPLLSITHTTTVLDIGCGGGDIALSLARWAERDGLPIAITAIDPDTRALDFARAKSAHPAVTYRCTDSAALAAADETFDVVLSNHMLHHLTAPELQALLADSARLAQREVIHSDIARSRLGYALFSAGTLPLARGSFIRRDGLTSIRRSYTPGELRAIIPAGWRVQTAHPYRNLLLYTPGRRHA